eukprot:scaffold104034_cov21-Tisochrysis_lutea.AAC.1
MQLLVQGANGRTPGWMQFTFESHVLWDAFHGNAGASDCGDECICANLLGEHVEMHVSLVKEASARLLSTERLCMHDFTQSSLRAPSALQHHTAAVNLFLVF